MDRLMRRCLAALAALSLGAGAARAADDFESQFKRVIDAYSIIDANAADAVDPNQAFYAGAIPGLLRSLDPHSVFFDPDQFEQLQKMESSTQKGFGSVVSLIPGRVIILQTLPGTPSAKAGLAPGDEILAINGYVVGMLEVDQLVELLTAARQGDARIDVRKAGTTSVTQLTLTPADLQSSPVERAFYVGAGIGYVRVSSFDANTAQELKAAIEKLGGNGLNGLVLDLRNNPGGLMAAALEVASLFLKPDSKILTVRGRHVPETSESVPSFAEPYSFKLAVLINEKTASASEIVSGALQDHDRATILGQDSFGKGLVQTVYPMSEKTGLALTTALYYIPSGRSIQKPLHASKFELAGATARPSTDTKEYKTDKGRIVKGGGGVHPDVVVYPFRPNELEMVLDGSGAFADFATQYLRENKVTRDFEVDSAMLDRFRVFLAGRRIQPSVSEWLAERSFITIRLETEIVNQAFGVEKGDEIDARRDPVIQKAVEVLGS
jgi:carboxyl-terminal processing protease